MVEKELQATVDPGFSVTFTSDFYIAITHGLPFEIDWQADNVGQILGFDSDCTPPAQSFVATQTPRFCWLPTWVRADQNTWSPNHNENFSGRRAQSGIVSGLQTGKVLYETTLTMDFEYGYNLRKSRCRTAAEQVRCLDYFVDGSRAAYPGSGNVPVGGFYFWPDYTDIDCLASMDEGDASTFNYTSGADTYVFCEFDPKFNVSVDPGLPVGHDYYNVKIPIRTSAIDTSWSAP
jgi:hypothetical protein